MFSKLDSKKLGQLLDQLILLYRKRKSEVDYDMLDDYIAVHEKIANLMSQHRPDNDEEWALYTSSVDRYLKAVRNFK